MTRDQLERMTFRALERVRNLGGDAWKSVFDDEMLDWSEWYWQAMDPAERDEWEHHRKVTQALRSDP